MKQKQHSAKRILLVRSIVNDRDGVDAVLDLIDLAGLITLTFGPMQRYHVADHLRSVADQAERGLGASAEVSV
ncbi:hypothetical protein HU230_0008885 [Bradyrhizobium quebecense]|uniref:Uncharacterized protein n=1 Tax=Bradyrhizobium quebecense TaxID=2748629 RepID=A0A973WPC8_9BRAD|nr:hypothetical protein [Bradyrhizobium quebecense]UGA46132.1 hypothetical protein HU230_0008885 [Bradyrhizobium quebecense]